MRATISIRFNARRDDVRPSVGENPSLEIGEALSPSDNTPVN